MVEKKKSIVVLGALTMEMRFIQHLLKDAGIQFVNATFAKSRVSAENAYSCDNDNIVRPIRYLNIEQVVFVECKPAYEMRSTDCVYIDHDSNKGDTSSDANFWGSSSLGQVVDWLFSNTTDAMKLMEVLFNSGYNSHDAEVVAAAEFDLLQAYKGACSNVTPAEVLERRVQFISEQFSVPQDEVECLIEACEDLIKSAPGIDLCGTKIADLREEDISLGLYEASAKSGQPFLSLKIMTDGRQKVTFGSASVDQLNSFESDLAPTLGLKGIIQNPARYRAFGFL